MNVILDPGKWSLELVVQSSCCFLLLGPFYSSRFACFPDWIEMNVNTHDVGPFSRSCWQINDMMIVSVVGFLVTDISASNT